MNSSTASTPLSQDKHTLLQGLILALRLCIVNKSLNKGGGYGNCEE